MCIEYYQEENIPFYVPEIKKSISNEVLIFVVAVLILANVVLVFAYRRCAKRELEENMSTKVNAAVSSYIALSQGKNNTTHGSDV